MRALAPRRTPVETPDVEHERPQKNPLGPEVALRYGEGPDEDAHEVDERVLQGERGPTHVPHPETRGWLAARELSKSLIEIAACARGVHLCEPVLELVDCEPPAVVVAPQLVPGRRPVGVGSQRVEALDHEDYA